MHYLKAFVLLLFLMRPLRAHGAGCRVNDAAAEVWSAYVWRPATIEITFGQERCHHADQDKHATGQNGRGNTPPLPVDLVRRLLRRSYLLARQNVDPQAPDVQRSLPHAWRGWEGSSPA